MAHFVNEELINRTLCIIVGIGLISLVFVGPKTDIGWVGLVPLITGLIGWRPVYSHIKASISGGVIDKIVWVGISLNCNVSKNFERHRWE